MKGSERLGDGIKGSYLLSVFLDRPRRLTIGRKGTFDFPAGHYFYCGSALNGLEARISRHLRPDKKLHWHIDYLVAEARILEVWWKEGSQRLECAWAEAIATLGGEVAVRGFGSSDCRCPTHLLWVGTREELNHVHAAAFADGFTGRQAVNEKGKMKTPQDRNLESR